jgi:hypothetical protein
MAGFGKEFFGFLGAIVGLAVLAVLVSRNANTTGVINSSSSFVNTALATAAGPVTGYSPGAPIYANGGGLGNLGSLFNTSSSPMGAFGIA